MTAYELSFDNWRETIDFIADHRERLAPGVRNACLHAFGNFLSEKTEYDRLSKRALGRNILKKLGHRPPSADAAEQGLSLKERAAVAVARIAKLSLTREGEDLVSQCRSWWLTHYADPEFQIDWSTSHPLRYAFMNQH